MPSNDEYVIPASIRSDDGVMSRSFDAVTWFSIALDNEIRALADGGWGGCGAADRVAEFYRNALGVRDVFTYLIIAHAEGDDAIGYECCIDVFAAERWLAIHKPHLYIGILRERLADEPIDTTTNNKEAMSDQQQPTPTPEPAPTELTIGNLSLLFHGDGVELRVAELAHKFTYAETQKLHGALSVLLIRTDTPENVKRRLNGRVRCPNCAGRLWVFNEDHIERCDGCKYFRDDYSAALALLANTPKDRPGAVEYEEEAARYGTDRGDQITEDDDN